MGIANVWGLIGLIGIPIIIILYMLRPKNKPMTIPSLYLWKQMVDEIESASRLKKLKSSILMFIQMLVVLLLSLILAGLFVRSTEKASKVLLIMECAYTMGATDVGSNRLEYGKELAADYIRDLGEDSEISVIALEEVPRTILKDEKDKGMALTAIDSLKVVDGISDIGLAVDTIELLREPEQKVVYVGDRKISGISRMTTIRDSRNFSVHEITYTKYLKEGNITALTEIFNQSEEMQIIPVSLYVDGLFFGAKQIEIEAGASGKLFFENIPLETERLHVQIDAEDILAVDNHSYCIIRQEKMQKVLLVSKSNRFLEKALALHPNVELYVSEENISGSGYDLYIYDGTVPEQLPQDGSYLIFASESNPVHNLFMGSDPKAEGFEGYVKNPVFSTNGHAITRHIEKTEFSTRISAVFTVEDSRNIIYDTQFGAGAFETVLNGNKAVVFGFDIHDTDLPLSIEFPVLMMNTVDYLLSNRMVEEGSIFTGDSVVVSIFPSTVSGDIVMPDGTGLPLDVDRREYVFSNTTQVGTYTVTQESGLETHTEQFTVNVPPLSEQAGSVGSDEGEEVSMTSRNLGRILGICALAFMMLEWLIYAYRRKIHEYSY